MTLSLKLSLRDDKNLKPKPKMWLKHIVEVKIISCAWNCSYVYLMYVCSQCSALKWTKRLLMTHFKVCSYWKYLICPKSTWSVWSIYNVLQLKVPMAECAQYLKFSKYPVFMHYNSSLHKKISKKKSSWCRKGSHSWLTKYTNKNCHTYSDITLHSYHCHII